MAPAPQARPEHGPGQHKWCQRSTTHRPGAGAVGGAVRRPPTAGAMVRIKEGGWHQPAPPPTRRYYPGISTEGHCSGELCDSHCHRSTGTCEYNSSGWYAVGDAPPTLFCALLRRLEQQAERVGGRLPAQCKHGRVAADHRVEFFKHSERSSVRLSPLRFAHFGPKKENAWHTFVKCTRVVMHVL